MKNLRSRIKTDFQNARNSPKKELALLLSTVLGEFDRCEIKNIPNNEVIKIVKKTQSDAIINGNIEEASLLDVYLPTKLSKDILTNIISDIIKANDLNGMKGLGFIMGKLKNDHPNAYDGKEASIIARKFLL